MEERATAVSSRELLRTLEGGGGGFPRVARQQIRMHASTPLVPTTRLLVLDEVPRHSVRSDDVPIHHGTHTRLPMWWWREVRISVTGESDTFKT